MALSHYQIGQSYQWNYDHAPDVIEVEGAAQGARGTWDFFGHEVRTPLGIAAGPLLNGQWVLYYAGLGFDVLTYKTVRSVEHGCHPLPNLQPVCGEMLKGDEQEVGTVDEMTGSWAVSFGMPSAVPDVWRRDIEKTRNAMSNEKVLSVSVVGTMQPGWGIEELAADYAQCAKWVLESGADCVETNFSCPNVATCDGQLYQAMEDARTVAQCVRAAIGDRKFLIKVGHLQNTDEAGALLDAVGEYVDGLAMTNSVATCVRKDGELMFNGARRGICGEACRGASVEQVRTFSRLINERAMDVDLVAVGGVSQAEHASEYLKAGASAVHLATAAMIDPKAGIRINAELGR